MSKVAAHASSLILHQYEISPFSEKVRVVLGMKDLPWHACNQPVIMPKPEMVRLTGGYRRIPVLQIGADLWLDSLYIIEELERRFPTPSVFDCGIGLSRAFAKWSDDAFFMTIVGTLFGGDWQYDEAFVKDRSDLIGAPFDPKQMAAAAPALSIELTRHLFLLESQLADGRPFLGGSIPGVLDAAVYCHIAFMRWGQGKAVELLKAHARVLQWADRVQAIGHGERHADVDRETAIILAKTAQPKAPAPPTTDSGFKPGDPVQVKYLDANTPVLIGELKSIDARGLTIRPRGGEVGDINIHLPHTIATLTHA